MSSALQFPLMDFANGSTTASALVPLALEGDDAAIGGAMLLADLANGVTALLPRLVKLLPTEGVQGEGSKRGSIGKEAGSGGNGGGAGSGPGPFASLKRAAPGKITAWGFSPGFHSSLQVTVVPNEAHASPPAVVGRDDKAPRDPDRAAVLAPLLPEGLPAFCNGEVARFGGAGKAVGGPPRLAPLADGFAPTCLATAAFWVGDVVASA